MIRAALLLPLLLAACTAGVPTDTQPATPATADALAQVGRWKLQGAADVEGRPIAAVLPHGRAVHALVFAGGQLAIEGGCNNIGARYRIDGSGRLVVPEIESTVMACMDEDLMAADSAVSALLHGSSQWSIAESYPEQLSLQHSDGRRSHWVANRVAVDPTRDGDGSQIALQPLSAGQLRGADLQGELACGFADADGATLLVARADVLPHAMVQGVLNNNGSIETLGNGQAGGFNDLLDGITLAGKGLAVELRRGEQRPTDNEATQHAAVLTVRRADGAERSYDGTLTCGP